ncbi:hypothetical protein EON83_29880 [bacterium]|nr:MAG: hypothetical protein EON83_29880 [bacterium]
MVNFRDVARNIERRAVNTALASIPREASISQALSQTGSPLNQLTANHDLNIPIPNPTPDGPPLTLLRANTINIEDGHLAP